MLNKYALLLTIITFPFLSIQMQAQKESSHWTIFYEKGEGLIDFNEEPPLLKQFESYIGGKSAISFPNGDLALIMGTGGIYDSSFNLVFDFNILGNYSQRWPIILMPVPNSEFKFIFLLIIRSGPNTKTIDHLIYGSLVYKDGKFSLEGEIQELGQSKFYDEKTGKASLAPNNCLWFYIRNGESNELEAFLLQSTGFVKTPVCSPVEFDDLNIHYTHNSISRDGRFMCSSNQIIEVSPLTGRIVKVFEIPRNGGVWYWNLCLSASQKWVYFNKIDNSKPVGIYGSLVRFQAQHLLSTPDESTFLQTEEYICDLPRWSPPKLGFDDCIYINYGEQMARIKHADEALDLLEIEVLLENDRYFTLPNIIDTKVSIIVASETCQTIELQCLGLGIKEYTWHFNDGSSPETTTSPRTTHTFTQTGTHTVGLDVLFQQGTTYSLQQEIYVAPCFSATISPDTGCAKQSLTLTTNLAPEKYTSFTWNFGDGQTSTQTTPAHTYAQPGEYTITLTVTRTDNTTESVQQKIIIYGGVEKPTIRY